MKLTLAVLVLLVAVGTVYTQNLLPAPAPDLPALPGLPAAPSLQPAPAQPKERTINQMLDEIQTIRAQKAELAKMEQALMTEVRKMVEQQNERLNKMGLGTPAQPPMDTNLIPAPLSSIPAPPTPESLPLTPGKR
jgi:Spy/CpxP family protein refolding chaperone